MWFEVIKVFMFGLVIDLMYVLWLTSVARNAKLRAGFASVALAAPGLFGVVAIVDNRWMALPYLLGLFLGTMLGIVLKQRATKKREGKV